MNEWALLNQRRQIVQVVTTNKARAEIQHDYPMYEVADLWSLPSKTQEAYQYWSERP